MGAIPGISRVNFHNPVLAYENGEEFMKFFYRAAEGKIEPFILVIEGVNTQTKTTRKKATGRLSEQTEKPDSPSRPVSGSTAWLPQRGVVAAGTCATYGGIHASSDVKLESVRDWSTYRYGYSL